MAYLAAVSSSTMPIFIRTKGAVPQVSVLTSRSKSWEDPLCWRSYNPSFSF